MPITVRVLGVEATVEGGEWSCPDDLVARYLRLQVPRDWPPASEPWPDHTLAAMAVERLKGEWVDEGTPPKYDPSVVY